MNISGQVSRNSVFERFADINPPYSKLSIPAGSAKSQTFVPQWNYPGLFMDEIKLYETAPVRLEVTYFDSEQNARLMFHAQYQKVGGRNVVHIYDGSDFVPINHIGVPKVVKELLEDHFVKIDSALSLAVASFEVHADIHAEMMVLTHLVARGLHSTLVSRAVPTVTN